MFKKLFNKIEIYLQKRSFKSRDQIFFAQRLSLLLGSGISITEALVMIQRMDISKNRKKIYTGLIEKTQRGITLSKSIKMEGIKFNNFLITLIQNGESSGRLVETLSLASTHLEKVSEIKKKIISSLMYPVFILFATLGMSLFLILYIFPKIIPLLSSLNIKLPFITRVVQFIYYFTISKGIWVFILMIMVFILLRVLILKNEKIRYRLHLLIIEIPLASKYLKIYKISTFCSMTEMLISSGRSLEDSIIFAIEYSKNLFYKKIFQLVSEDVLKGISFADSARKYQKYLTHMLVDMTDLGERTGNLANMLGHCGRIFDQDLENLIKRFSSLTEPVLMVFMGLIVGSIALSIILPVYEITNHLSK